MRLAYSHLDNVNYTTVQWYGGVDTVIISRIHRAQTFLGDETQAFRKTMLHIGVVCMTIFMLQAV